LSDPKERYYELIDKLGWDNVSRRTAFLEYKVTRDVYEATIYGVVGKPREVGSIRYRVEYQFPAGFLEGKSDVSEEDVLDALSKEREETWEWMRENGWKILT